MIEGTATADARDAATFRAARWPRSRTRSAEASARLPQSLKTAEAPVVTAEVADLDRLEACEADWRALAERSAEPNPFMDPAFLAGAGEDVRRLIRVLLAWTGAGANRRLVGCWALRIARPTPKVPLPVLVAPAIDKYAFLGSPVVDGAHAENALKAMLDAIAADPDLPKTLLVSDVAPDGVVGETLSRLLAESGMPLVELEQRRRARLCSELDGPSYLRQSVSAGTRKKLRQHRKRLAAEGEVEVVTYSEAADVAHAFERFLELEGASWKGRAGTALISDAADAAFAREAIRRMASEGRARIEALTLDGRIVSAQVLLSSGQAVFTWKIAHDEAFARYSPGTLLVESYTAKLLADPAVAFADSCSRSDDGLMASLWSERMTVMDFCFDVRRGGSPRFRLVVAVALGERRLRALAKRVVAEVGQYRARMRSCLAGGRASRRA